MAQYTIVTSENCIMYRTYLVEADSQEEAEENYEDGEIADIEYENCGNEVIE